MRPILAVCSILLLCGCSDPSRQAYGTGQPAPTSMPDPERARMTESQLLEEVRVAEAELVGVEESARQYEAEMPHRLNEKMARMASAAQNPNPVVRDEFMSREAEMSKLQSETAEAWISRRKKARKGLDDARSRLKQFLEANETEARPAQKSLHVQPRPATTDRTT